MPPTVAFIDLACTLLEQHPVRAYDATHPATALSAQRFLMAQSRPALMPLYADARLNDAASAEGLAVDNPNRHFEDSLRYRVYLLL